MFVQKHLYAVLAMLVLLSLIAGCAAPAAAPAAEQPAAEQPAPAEVKPIKIGVTMLFDDRWLTKMRDAMTNYAASQPGVELIMVDSREDVGTQLGQVENFISQGVDAIVIVAANTDATEPMTQAIMEAGIPLVYVNRRPANLPEGVVYVGSDSIIAGRLQMEWIAEALGGQGNVVIMMGNLAQEAAQQRTAGVKEVAAKYPGITITKEQSANWDRAEGMALMENWLATGDRIDAVASNNDEMAIGALKAIEAAGKLGEIIVGGVDATEDALAEMAAGRLNVTVFQNAKGQGEGAIEAAIKLARGEAVEPVIWIPYELVTPENYKEYLNR
ncbi:MAG: sugar ABC transporter substrate-binding protein [Caldilinea sp.]|nr:sugar ABC transporter substrate-binding protein [Caldilinea sp.]MDW8438947.1 sugar ABC transporter substrate-binding protein [Caldilineaceae bacterium]